VSELIQAHKQGRKINVVKIKQQCAKKNGMQGLPKLTQIIAAVPEQFKKVIVPLLLAKPVRTASGIAVVAVMSKPHRCPHIAITGGVCIYCPGY
jgi:elongator complex protein 3